MASQPDPMEQWQLWQRFPGSYREPRHAEWAAEIERLRAVVTRAKEMLRNWSPEYVAELDAMLGPVPPADDALEESIIVGRCDVCERPFYSVLVVGVRCASNCPGTLRAKPERAAHQPSEGC